MAKEKNVYTEALRSLQEDSESNKASWIVRLRENALERFETLGFPTTAQEEWKYTNVAPITKADFEPVLTHEDKAPHFDANQLKDFTYPEAERSQLVFINGIYHPELSSLDALPESIIAMDLKDALNNDAHAERARTELARMADYQENAFTALNTALWSSGAFLFIPKNVKVESPVHLLFLSGAENALKVSFPRVLVIAERGSESTLIESYAGLDDKPYWTNAVIEIALEDDARLEHYKVQRESAEAFHIANTGADLGQHSSYQTTTITLGSQISRHEIGVALNREGAECRVDGLYIANTGQHTDTHSLIDHRQPNCTSRQLYKGILDGKSRAVFNGKVFVHKGAHGTDAVQTNRNLLLSKDARVDTKPQLEIFNEDVKCAHGATVGQLEEEEVFYLLSRGLHPDLAQNLLTYGFAEEVIAEIKIESIKAQLDEAVLNRLHARLEVR